MGKGSLMNSLPGSDSECSRQSLLEAVERDPANVQALHQLGIVTAQGGDFVAAEGWFRRALAIAPSQPDLISSLAFLLSEAGRHWEAIDLFKQAVTLDRRNERTLYGIANAYLRKGDLAESAFWWRQLIAVAPDTADAHFNLGLVCRRMFDHQQAAREIGAAIALMAPDAPRLAFAHYMRGLTLLAIGEWKEGWAEYEWRLKDAMKSQADNFDAIAPRWDGRPMPGQRLLVHAEQGLGDTINFCRYLKFPMFDGTVVILHCQEPLKQLMETSFGRGLVVVSGEKVPECDAQLPLMSMPHTLAGRFGSAIPAEVPYLAASPERVAVFAAELERLAPGRRRIAIAWRGNPKNPSDGERSIEPEVFAPLLTLDAEFFAIQPGADIGEFRRLGYDNVHDLSGLITDFADTAAAVQALDGLIAVDTSVAHLAGALDKPAWVLLAHLNDWRWGLFGHMTPWYRSVRLYRQARAGDWPSALIQLGRDFAAWLVRRTG
ncbi:MAG: tetratricopeptide repeat protein [Actinomycetota bacterium]